MAMTLVSGSAFATEQSVQMQIWVTFVTLLSTIGFAMFTLVNVWTIQAVTHQRQCSVPRLYLYAPLFVTKTESAQYKVKAEQTHMALNAYYRWQSMQI